VRPADTPSGRVAGVLTLSEVICCSASMLSGLTPAGFKQ
jgi:hypothetical protein